MPRPESPPAGYHRDQVLIVLPEFKPATVKVSKLGSKWEPSAKRIVLERPSRTLAIGTSMPAFADDALRAPLPVAMNMPSLVALVAKIGRLPPLAR